ncbi:hypothetical protein BDN67DRAFT_874319, partial [Paxillus ammoniavirescens]
IVPDNPETPSPTAQDPLGSNFEEPVQTIRRSTRQRKESPYMHALRDDAGTHDGQRGGTIFPPGVQPVEGQRENSGGESVGGVADASVQWELEAENAYAMFAGTCEAEALESHTVDEAHLQPDWPRWDEAIKSELKSLDDAHTWDVVQRP